LDNLQRNNYKEGAGIRMSGNQKKIVSMRISENDHLKIKRIAKRLEAKDSDVIRFAIKTTLSKLSPLDRKDRVGSDVLAAFIEIGKELANFFDLDADKLENIINNGSASLNNQVEYRDIELIAMSALPEHFLQRKIQDMVDAKSLEFGVRSDIENVLREYLYKKYLCSTQSTTT